MLPARFVVCVVLRGSSGIARGGAALVAMQSTFANGIGLVVSPQRGRFIILELASFPQATAVVSMNVGAEARPSAVTVTTRPKIF